MSLSEHAFTEDEQTAIARLLAGMPHADDLFGTMEVLNLDDLIRWLDAYRKRLVQHAEAVDELRTKYKGVIDMIDATRRWHALSTQPPGSPIA